MAALSLVGCSSSETESTIDGVTGAGTGTGAGTSAGTSAGTGTTGTGTGTTGTGSGSGTTDDGLPDGGVAQGAGDNSAGVGFTHGGWVFEESDMTVEIPVQRNDSGVGQVSVGYSAVFGSLSAAELDGDVNGTLTWADGDTETKYIKAQIMADLDEESDESFRINLSQPVGAVLGGVSTTLVTVQDSACNKLDNSYYYIKEKTIFDKHCYSGTSIDTNGDDSEVIIEPGVSFFLSSQASFDSSSAFTIVGEPDKRIWFRGVAAERDNWDGVYITSSKQAGNRLENVVIRDAGNGNQSPALFIRDTRLSLVNVDVSHNGGYGMEVGDDVVFENFTANTFSDNALGSMLIEPNNVASLDALSDYSGNDRDGIDITYGSDLTLPGTWEVLNAPYTARSLDIKADLVIEAGVTVLMRDSSIFVQADGSLTAIGTQARPIVFKGEQETPSFWGALYFKSNDTKNILEHVTISHAGDPSAIFYNPLSLAADARLQAKNITITDSLSNGVYVSRSNFITTLDPAEFTFINVARSPHFVE